MRHNIEYLTKEVIVLKILSVLRESGKIQKISEMLAYLDKYSSHNFFYALEIRVLVG